MSVNGRQLCLWIHRYTGLIMAGFLIVAGLTGSLLAFHDELDNWFNHDLAYIEPIDKAQLPIADLHDQVIDAYPQYKFSSMPTSIAPARSAVFTVDRERGKHSDQPKSTFQEVYVNPYNGDILGTRDKEQWAWRNTMWKVFWLHRDLLLGDIGKLILGIIALIWTINCFIGFYLTLPRAIKRANSSSIKNSTVKTSTMQNDKRKKRASFFKRWLPAWKIRRKSNTFKLNYDLHHAFGLWLWLMLFVIAWSSVGFNLQPVYQPVMQTLVGLEAREHRSKPPVATEIKNSGIVSHNIMSYVAYSTSDTNERSKAYQVNKHNSIAYVSQQATIAAEKNDVKVERLLGIRLVQEESQWKMRFKTDQYEGKKGGASTITVDAVTGHVEKVTFGYQAPFATQADHWLATLHMGHIGQNGGHLLYQLFLMLIGLAVTVLSATGVYLWYKGRQRRQSKTYKNKNE